jgi:hypothetical protein
LRQHVLDQIFGQCQRICHDHHVAFERAVREEDEIAKRSSTSVIYRSRAGNKVLVLSKEANDLDNAYFDEEEKRVGEDVKAPAPPSPRTDDEDDQAAISGSEALAI